jgi:ribosomal protein S18 acetylase RimI-like enzyme
MKVIDIARDSHRTEEARALFREYGAELGINLNFQGFEEELAGLPGRYAPPAGCLLFAEDGEHVLGCIALRQLEPGLGEVKRMYVRPAHRGRGVARALIERLLDFAVEAGYARLRLDTLESMTAARNLYEGLGFTRIDPYYHNPIPNVAYYELVLPPPPSGVA